MTSREQHERDHQFIAEMRGALRLLSAVLGLNFAGVVYLVWHGIHP
jgi:hypothetical protein